MPQSWNVPISSNISLSSMSCRGQSHGADFSPTALRAAAQGLDIPNEFERLIKEIEARSHSRDR